MEKIKWVLITIGAFLSASFGALLVPIFLLVALNVIDYITGLMAAHKRKQVISSYKSISGIAKKICMWLLVVVGAFIDMLLDYLAAGMGWTLPFGYAVGALVCVWLVANEVISIIENMADIGVAVPPFILPVIKWIKGKAENTGKLDEE